MLLYKIFGEPNRVSDVNNPYLFTGRRLDPETSNYYYRARYYKPSIGRFLQPDPIGYGDGLNLYAYCGNNPINWVDMFGLCKSSDEPALGTVISEVIDSAIMPWKLDPAEVETWRAYKKQSWLTHLVGLTPDPSLPLQLSWSWIVGKATVALGDAKINLIRKSSGSEYWAAYLKIQEYQYKRHFIFWGKWKPIGRPCFYQVRGGYRYEPFFEAYAGVENAAKAIEREELQFDYRW